MFSFSRFNPNCIGLFSIRVDLLDSWLIRNAVLEIRLSVTGVLVIRKNPCYLVIQSEIPPRVRCVRWLKNTVLALRNLAFLVQSSAVPLFWGFLPCVR